MNTNQIQLVRGNSIEVLASCYIKDGDELTPIDFAGKAVSVSVNSDRYGEKALPYEIVEAGMLKISLTTEACATVGFYSMDISIKGDGTIRFASRSAVRVVEYIEDIDRGANCQEAEYSTVQLSPQIACGGALVLSTNVAPQINAKGGDSGISEVVAGLQNIVTDHEARIKALESTTANHTTAINTINYILGNINTDIPLINHGTTDTTLELSPNVLHTWGEVASLTLTLGNGRNGIVNEYIFQFASGETATMLTLPDFIKWSSEPVISPNKMYQVSIVDGLGLIAEF